MLFEVTILIELHPDANFIASDSTERSLEEVIQDIIYDVDDMKIVEIEVKQA